MCDCMNFPKTIDEFINDYSFKDNQEVYTNGSELIQVFRVKQALEHYMEAERNKAIEEFAEAIKINCELGFVGCLDRVIDEIAEKLEGGSNNGFE